MSSFLSDNISEIFCKYDDNYISPSVKRFLRECIIQLIDVSLLSINGSPNSSNRKLIGIAHTKLERNFSKQLSLLAEWLENFIEPSHVSMYTQTIVHIIRQFEKNTQYSSNTAQHTHRGNHSYRHSFSSRTPRHSMSMTNITNSTEFAMTPVGDTHIILKTEMVVL